MRLPSFRRSEGRGHTGIGPIGFDLAADQLHMVQMECERESLRVHASISRRYPVDREAILEAPADLKAMVAGALRSQPFRGKKVVTVVPGDLVKLMVLSYELGPRDSEPELILALVEERIQESLDEWVVDYLPIRPSHEKQSELSALVAIVRKDVVFRYLELLRAAGLDVEALEIPPVAIRRLVTRLAMRDLEDDVMILHFGREKSHLTVLWGRRLILYREIEFGVDRAIEQVAKSLDLPSESAASLLAEYGVYPDGPYAGLDRASAEIAETTLEILTPGFAAVAEQIGNAIVYTASRTRGASVDLICLVGAIARWPGVDRLVNSLASIPVRILDPLQTITGREGPSSVENGGAASGIALATSLALRGFGDGE